MLRIRHLSPRPFFRSGGVAIRGIGIREVMVPGHVDRPRGTGDYLFMMFHDPVEIGPPGARKPVPAGTMMLWDRGAAHFYGQGEIRWSHSWIHCDGSGIGRFLRAARAPLGRPLRLADPSRIERPLFDLHEEFSGRWPPDPVIVRNLLVNLIREAVRNPRRLRRRPATEGLLRARELIDRRYDEPLDLSFLARTAGLSPAHFCVEFRRCFGTPPIAYLIQRRMRVAALLLGGTGGRVGEIGRRVGYADPYYFSKHFKAVHGVPPSRLRVG